MMTDKKKIKRIKRISIVVLILLFSFVVDHTYYRIFYSKTDARVVFSETKAVGTGAYGVPVWEKTIKIMYVTEEGITYTAELIADPMGFVRAGDIVSVKYKKSNPEKCFLD